MGWDFSGAQRMWGVRLTRGVRVTLAGGALLLGCGSTRNDEPIGRSGSSGANAFAGNAGSVARGGSGTGGSGTGGVGGDGHANAGRAGSNGKAGAAGNGGEATAGGGSSVGLGGAASNVPLDTRPARPAWKPPFAVGTPGWRESSEALCEHHQGDQEAFDVWADSRGVFGLFAASCNVLGGTRCGQQGVSLQFNDGTGWHLLYAVPPGSGMGSNGGLRLAGFDSGPLLVSGFMPDRLGIWRITTAGEIGLDAALEVNRPVTVGAHLAYALGPETLYRFIDDQWTEYLTLPAPAQSLWADEDRIVIVGTNQAVYEKRTADADFVTIPGAPAGDYSAVWSFGVDDIWVGNQAAQLVHYDGAKWTVFETGSKDVSGAGILQLWGSSDGQLFFRTFGEMGRYDGSQLKLLLELPATEDPSRIRVKTGGLWGLSSTEVFLAVTDGQFNQYACGGQFMLFFDGTSFHSF